MKKIPADEDDVVFRELPCRQKAKRIIIALAVVIILLFILCLIFIVLFSVEKNKTHEEESGSAGPSEESIQKTCASKKCLFAAVGKFEKQLFLYMPGVTVIFQVPFLAYFN